MLKLTFCYWKFWNSAASNFLMLTTKGLWFKICIILSGASREEPASWITHFPRIRFHIYYLLCVCMHACVCVFIHGFMHVCDQYAMAPICGSQRTTSMCGFQGWNACCCQAEWQALLPTDPALQTAMTIFNWVFAWILLTLLSRLLISLRLLKVVR